MRLILDFRLLGRSAGKLLLGFWLVGLAFLSPAHSQANMLQQLLEQQRRSYSGACITSGYYDARGVSRYRSQPGLHLGYDIAMPYGTPVRAAWPGTVVAHIPWSDTEWGVVVQHGDGSRATYGHVTPRAAIGATLQPGDILASIASDHLDVKLRDGQGNPFDYGGSLAVSATVAPPDSTRLALQQKHSRLLQLLRNQLKGSGPRSPELAELERRGLKLAPSSPARPVPNPEWQRLVQDYRKLQKQAPKVGLEALTPAESSALEKALRESREHWQKQDKLYPLGLVSQKAWQSARKQHEFWQALADVLGPNPG